MFQNGLKVIQFLKLASRVLDKTSDSIDLEQGKMDTKARIVFCREIRTKPSSLKIRL